MYDDIRKQLWDYYNYLKQLEVDNPEINLRLREGQLEFTRGEIERWKIYAS